jgi:hypothetical protein
VVGSALPAAAAPVASTHVVTHGAAVTPFIYYYG